MGCKTFLKCVFIHFHLLVREGERGKRKREKGDPLSACSFIKRLQLPATLWIWLMRSQKLHPGLTMVAKCKSLGCYPPSPLAPLTHQEQSNWNLN